MNNYPFRKIPDDLPSGCCEAMKRHLRQNSDCEQHGYNCPDRGISYANGEYLLRAPNANYEIFFCPWCGNELIETRARSEEEPAFMADALSDLQACGHIKVFEKQDGSCFFGCKQSI